MPSIRRNLLGYLLLLLALALGGVGVLVDQFAKGAIRERENAETRRIDEAFKLRQREAQQQFDTELLNETRALARELQPKLGLLLGQWAGRGGPGQPSPRPPEGVSRSTDPSLRAPESEIDAWRTRVTLLLLGSDLVGWRTAATAYAIDPLTVMVTPGSGAGPRSGPRPSPIELPRLSPLWIGYDTPRAVPRIQEALRKLFDDEDHAGYFQFDLVVNFPGQPGHLVVITRSARLGHDLPAVDPDALDRNADTEYEHSDIEIPGKGRFRQVVKVGGRPWLSFPVFFTPPTQIAPGRTAPRPADMFLRVYVHHARPYSELDDRLDEEERNGLAELDRVREETRKELTQLRARLGLIGLGTFAALVLGGWFIVARGLAPVHKLSEAVSHVSEKDFRMPVRPDDLSRELVPIHSRLTQTFELLQRAFAREKQAVADISHELRTPIASLMATLDVALRKPRTQEQYRATLEDCRAITKQLSQLVERIMILASLDAGSARTTVARSDAAEIADGCAAVIRPLAASHGLTFKSRVDAPLELDTDPDKLREVLINLLHNAVEYNQPGGSIELFGRRENGSVVLEVRDTGIGMTPEVREKIFERFYRADPSRHATGVHAGLGLAIVKEYVGRLGGTIGVQSEPGAGSTFRVELPAAGEVPEEPAPPDFTARADPPPPARPVRSRS
jgi:two-component system heavy metal sensor histidine kinase CusS